MHNFAADPVHGRKGPDTRQLLRKYLRVYGEELPLLAQRLPLQENTPCVYGEEPRFKIEKSPMDGVPVRKRPKYAPRPVENIQLAKILKNSAKNTRVMVLLAALCGLRVHKIAKIRGSDLDLEKRTPAVIGKGNKRSIIPLHEIIVDTAQSMPESGWWFPSLSDVDKPISGKSCGQAISRAMRRAGVEGTAHQLRHSYGTALLESGEVDLRTLQELMRHESLATTQIYTRVTSERWREAIDNLCLPIVV